jgi:environmental stress-induced protein Ves
MRSEADPGMQAAPIGTRVAHAMQAPGTWTGGTTRMIYAYPPGPGLTPATALFWVGTAVIQQPAAYSFFPDRTRIHIPIQGNGVRLHFQAPAEVVALDTFEQHRFDGARPVQVELVDGPVEAFNLIAQSDLITEAQVIRVDAEAAAPAFPSTPPAQAADGASVVRVVYVVTGTVAIQIGGREEALLRAGDAFVVHPRPVPDSLHDRVELRGEAANAIVVAASILFRAGA